jgi:hypothetical protein
MTASDHCRPEGWPIAPMSALGRKIDDCQRSLPFADPEGLIGRTGQPVTEPRRPEVPARPLDAAGVHHRATAHPTQEPTDTARPLDVPTRERPVRRNCSIFGCRCAIQLSVRYSVVGALFGCRCAFRSFFGCVASADRRPATVAGSVVARHPAGGTTRRRSTVLMYGGPFRADDTVGSRLQDATCHPT